MSVNTLALWSFIAIVAIMDAVGLHLTGMSIQMRPFLPTVITVFATLALTLFYTRLRPNPRIASLTHMTAASLTFMAVGAVFSYLCVGVDRPLIDPYLVAVDHALGFNWLKTYDWIAARPKFQMFLTIIYASLTAQMALLQIILNFRGDFARSREMVWLIAISGIGCVLFSTLWPAMGAFGYFHVNPHEPYLREFLALRNHELKVIGAAPVQGVDQFPSFHFALAAIICYAARDLRFIFPVFLLFNTLVIVATPPIGGHHVADLLGGAVLILLAIMIAGVIMKNLPLPATSKKRSRKKAA